MVGAGYNNRDSLPLNPAPPVDARAGIASIGIDKLIPRLHLPRAISGEFIWIRNYPAGNETLRVFETLRVLTAVHPISPFHGRPPVDAAGKMTPFNRHINPPPASTLPVVILLWQG